MTESFSIAAFADAGATVGLGHLRRTTVIAQALAGRGLRVLLATPTPEAVPADTGVEIRAASGPGELPPAPIVLLDSMRATAAELAARRTGTTRLVVVDDLAERSLPADLVINPNIYGPDLDYAPLTAARVLSGLAWCPVAPAFAAARAAVRHGSRILLAFGGTDDGRFAVPAARALRARCDWPLDVVVSPLRPLAPAVRAELEGLGSVAVHHGARVPELMARATHYVGASGSTVWEALTAGLSPVVAAIAENQRPIVAALAAAGLPALPAFVAQALAAAAVSAADTPALSQLLDGRGAERIAAEIAALAEAEAPPLQEERIEG